MGIFDFIKREQSTSKFVSEADYRKNHDNQISMAPQTLEQLRKLGVSNDKELRLEYFFYTNSTDKAGELAQELSKKGYSVNCRKAADNKRLFVVTGWTNKIIMTDHDVKHWASDMCTLGFKFDCDFDGWGTNPEQD